MHKHTVFISYSRKDVDIAKQLAQDLEKADLEVWWDISDLKGGDAWIRTIQAALKASKYCVVLLSPEAVESEWVEKEYTFAMGLGLKIIPILHKNCEVPLALANIQYIDVRGKKYKRGLQELFEILRVLAPNEKEESTVWGGLPIWGLGGIALAALVIGVATFLAIRGGKPTATPTPVPVTGRATTPAATVPSTAIPVPKVVPTVTPYPTDTPILSTPTSLPPTDTPTSVSLVFSDDFSTDRGWTNQTSGHFSRDARNEWLSWHIHRSTDEKYYTPIGRSV